MSARVLQALNKLAYHFFSKTSYHFESIQSLATFLQTEYACQLQSFVTTYANAIRMCLQPGDCNYNLQLHNLH
jgi:hypothetical protein